MVCPLNTKSLTGKRLLSNIVIFGHDARFGMTKIVFVNNNYAYNIILTLKEGLLFNYFLGLVKVKVDEWPDV